MKNFKEDTYRSDLELKMGELQSQFLLDNKNDIDYKFNKFLNCLTSVINYHAPLVKMSKKEIKMQHKPWITKAILKSYKHKIKLYKIQLKTKKSEDKIKYKKFSNILTHIKKTAKTLYYRKLFSDTSGNSKKPGKL